jgi:hypothetical protein
MSCCGSKDDDRAEDVEVGAKSARDDDDDDADAKKKKPSSPTFHGKGTPPTVINKTKRNCTNLPFLLLFGAAWVAIIWIYAVSKTRGANYKR